VSGEAWSARFRLRPWHCEAIAARVKARYLCLLATLAVVSSCEKQDDVVVTETRVATSRDVSPKLFATSDERFRNAKPSPVKGTAPDGWLALPSSQFRLLNYRFGESGTGEVWVSLSSGGVINNVNRWLGQFGTAALDQAGLDELRSVPIAGNRGVWVEAAGDYAGGMGAPPKSDYALAGVISEINGRILTVKMVGPKSEVETARPILETFAKNLELAK
jgi:hypothetical protein